MKYFEEIFPSNCESNWFVDTQDKDPTEYATLCIRWLSKKERRVDALALRADERRDKLR